MIYSLKKRARVSRRCGGVRGGTFRTSGAPKLVAKSIDNDLKEKIRQSKLLKIDNFDKKGESLLKNFVIKILQNFQKNRVFEKSYKTYIFMMSYGSWDAFDNY